MTHKYYGLPPADHGEFTIGHEKMYEMLSDIEPLYQMHYEEVEKAYLPESDYQPDWRSYEALERDGSYVVFTVREYSTVVGYLQYHVYRDLHAQGEMTAREDCFFLHRDYRGKGLAPKLLDYAEHFLRKLGCTYVGMTDKSPVGGAPISGFLQNRGYGLVAHYLVKKLEK